MAKTRRQRRLEHPNMPKNGVRDQRRKVTDEEKKAASLFAGIGANAAHKTRGLETASPSTRQEVSMKGVEARQKKRKEARENEDKREEIREIEREIA